MLELLRLRENVKYAIRDALADGPRADRFSPRVDDCGSIARVSAETHRHRHLLDDATDLRRDRRHRQLRGLRSNQAGLQLAAILFWSARSSASPGPVLNARR